MNSTKFLKNAWYVACPAREATTKPFGRLICGEPVAIYRTESGGVHAVLDACPHRKAPLSMGRVEGENIRCIYHGMSFDTTGRCTHIPSQDMIPPRARVRTFPVQERFGLIWIWPGEPALAAESPLPDRPWLEDQSWNHDIVQYFPVKSSYTLMNDNLLDLSHVAFLHWSSIGFDPRRLANDPLKTIVEPERVTNERVFSNTTQAPAHKSWHEFPGNVNRVQQSQWTPPANVTVLVRNEDANPASDGKKVDMRADHFITPETTATHHYFILISRNFGVNDRTLTENLNVDSLAVHMEDVQIAEAQQRNAVLLPEMTEMPMRADKAVTAANKILDELIALEQSQPPCSLTAKLS